MPKTKLQINGFPAGNRVLIRKFSKEEYTKLSSGVIVPEESEKQPYKGEILAVGDVKKAKVGDIVLFNQSYGSGVYEIRIGGQDCILLNEEAIMFYIK